MTHRTFGQGRTLSVVVRFRWPSSDRFFAISRYRAGPVVVDPWWRNSAEAPPLCIDTECQVLHPNPHNLRLLSTFSDDSCRRTECAVGPIAAHGGVTHVRRTGSGSGHATRSPLPAPLPPSGGGVPEHLSTHDGVAHAAGKVDPLERGPAGSALYRRPLNDRVSELQDCQRADESSLDFAEALR